MSVQRLTLREATVGKLSAAWADSRGLFLFYGLLWVIQLLDTFVFRGALSGLGVRPREPIGLVGIVLAPFLHAGLVHLGFNTVFGWSLTLVAKERAGRWFVPVGVVAALGSGLGAWVLGVPGTVTVGFSGVLFGYLGFLVAQLVRGLGLKGQEAIGMLPWSAILISLLPGVSWQGHLFGFLAGAAMGAVLTRKGSIRVVRRPAPRG